MADCDSCVRAMHALRKLNTQLQNGSLFICIQQHLRHLTLGTTFRLQQIPAHVGPYELD